MEHLTNIEIKGFLPFDSQIRLVQLLLASTPSLERMTLALQMLGVEGSEAVNFRIPCYGGRWVPPVLGDANVKRALHGPRSVSGRGQAMKRKKEIVLIWRVYVYVLVGRNSILTTTVKFNMS